MKFYFLFIYFDLLEYLSFGLVAPYTCPGLWEQLLYYFLVFMFDYDCRGVTYHGTSPLLCRGNVMTRWYVQLEFSLYLKSMCYDDPLRHTPCFRLGGVWQIGIRAIGYRELGGLT